MTTMYVISNETGEIVATITASSATDEFGRSDADQIQGVFMDRFGPNDFSNSYTDQDADYAEDVEEIAIGEDDE